MEYSEDDCSMTGMLLSCVSPEVRTNVTPVTAPKPVDAGKITYSPYENEMAKGTVMDTVD